MKSTKLISSAIAMLICFITFGQEKTITGKVTDSNGQELPGVNVNIKGSQTGVSTGFDGLYSIKAKVGDVLVYSFIGFKEEKRLVSHPLKTIYFFNC
jgi:Ca-activated chloride channel homolog